MFKSFKKDGGTMFFVKDLLKDILEIPIGTRTH